MIDSCNGAEKFALLCDRKTGRRPLSELIDQLVDGFQSCIVV